jgi:hypothetical protein
MDSTTTKSQKRLRWTSVRFAASPMILTLIILLFSFMGFAQLEKHQDVIAERGITLALKVEQDFYKHMKEIKPIFKLLADTKSVRFYTVSYNEFAAHEIYCVRKHRFKTPICIHEYIHY